MITQIPKILANWRVIGIAFAVLSLIGAFLVYRGALIREGMAICRAEQTQGVLEVIKETAAPNKEVEKGYERIVTKFVKVPSGCVSDADKSSNKWLRDNYTNYSE